MRTLHEVWDSFGEAMEEWAQVKTRSEKPEVWFRELGDGDSSFLMMRLFLHTFENNGSFVDSVSYWDDFHDELVAAFNYLGFPDAAALAPQSLILSMRRKSEFSYELEAEMKKIDGLKGVRAEDVMRALLAESSRFSVDVRAFL